jgi:ERF superfamily
MHRSSESIGNISAALAKAQVELTNPEKSLVAIIRSPFPRERDRTFRYAPLSSGLDIIRKSLGRHEIATIQSTDIDKEAGLLRLTTILSHSSGEWISSEWPVCPISDVASAQRMGTALTYARRYALFALVGIAGEDDLDAPDLGASAAELPRPWGWPSARPAPTQRKPGGDGRLARSSAGPLLGEQLSASLRESLIKQMAAISSEDEAAAWAHRNLPAKNTLTATDAKIVEERFQARLGEISHLRNAQSTSASSGVDVDGPAPSRIVTDRPCPVRDQNIQPAAELADPVTDEKARAASAKRSGRRPMSPLGKTVRLRDKDHRKFVLRHPCLVCGRVPSDPHHLTFTQPRALGRRVSDEFTVPVCRLHHRELHRSGNEVAWWRQLNIDPLPVAARLWQQSRADGELFPPTEGVAQARRTQTTDVSAQDRSGTNRNPNTNSGSAA